MLEKLEQDLMQDKLVFLVFLFGSWLIPLVAALLLGIRNPIGIAQAVVIYSILSLPLALLLVTFRKRSFKKAEESEIKLEDDILLQATAFSQSALWIYINIAPANDFFSAMKWIVPSVAITFYAMRAYGKMKNSNFWRYRSVFALIITITSSITILVWSLTWENLWKYLFIIDGYDLRGLLYIYFFIGPVLAIYVIQNNLKERYGLPLNNV